MQQSSKAAFMPFIVLFVIIGFAAGPSVSIFELGQRLTGVTDSAVAYYFAGCALSVGILLGSKTARANGTANAMFMSLYGFGLAMVYFAGFNSMDPAPVDTKLSDWFASIQASAVCGAIWVIPVIVTGYLVLKVMFTAKSDQ